MVRRRRHQATWIGQPDSNVRFGLRVQPVNATHYGLSHQRSVADERPRIHYTESQKALMWERWQKGESLQQIAQLFDRNHSSIQGILAATGGIRPAPRRRSRWALTLAEREEISRAVVAGHSMRSIAAQLGRAPSTISREIKRNGGQECYRASQADQAAWDRGRRPKTGKLAAEPSAGAPRGRQAPTAVVTGAGCRLAQAHLSRRSEPSGVTRDHLSQPVHPGPRRPEEGTGGAFAAQPRDAPFAPSHPEDGRSRPHH